MFFLTLLSDYMVWHYGNALISFVRVFKNIWWFITQFFSIPQLASSLIAPYKRMTERPGSLGNIEGWIGYILINTISRILGFTIRVIIISTGVVGLLAFCLLALMSYGVWLVAPLLIVYCFVHGVYLLL